jgi:AsmA protein
MRRIALVAVGILALLLILLAVLPFLVDANRFKPALEANLSKALGRQVTVGDLGLSLWSGNVTAGELGIGDDPAFNQAPFLHAKSLKLAVALRPLLFSRKLRVTGLEIDEPQIMLLQNASGDWNFSTLGGKAAQPAPSAPPVSSNAPAGQGGLDLSADLVRISGGRFSLRQGEGHAEPMTLEDVNLEVRNFSSARAFPFTLTAHVGSGGDIKLAGTAGPIDATDASLTPVSATLSVTGLDLAGLRLAGPNSGLAGLASFQGSVNSAMGLVKLDAQLKAEKMKLATNGTPARRTVEIDFTVNHDLRKNAGTLERCGIHIGAALASLTGTYAQRGDFPVFNMKLTGPKMPVPELAELLPPMGIVLPSGSSLQGGFASADFTAEGSGGQLTGNGSVGLNNTRLAGFDLGSKMSRIESLAGIHTGPDTDIETLTANVKMTPAGIDAEDIHFLAPAIGELTGGGTVSPANALDFKMRATVHTSGVAAVLSKTAIPFLIQGDASNPDFKPDVKALAAEEGQKVKATAGKAAAGVLNNLLGGGKK